MSIEIPSEIRTALETLNRSGYEAYAVGGCVRDSLLSRTPGDWDICTSALPEQTQACFSGYRTVPTGIKHGTVTVIIGSPVEITTFRIDGDYADNRHPKEVEFTSGLADDLKRRDFTINAMALGTDGKIVDLFGGRTDLKNGIIRAVGDPEQRFDEDALRIMRALRFAATLGFTIEPATAGAIHKKRLLLSNISSERIRTETDKLLRGKCSRLLTEFSDVFGVFLPEALPVTPEKAAAIESADGLCVKLALLLQSLEPVSAQTVLQRMRYDKSTVRTVGRILSCAQVTLTTDMPCVRRLLNRAGVEIVRDIAEFELFSGAITQEARDTVLRTAEKIVSDGECFTLSALAVNGRDIKKLQICPDSRVGSVLHALLEAVMDSSVPNEHNALLKYAESALKY